MRHAELPSGRTVGASLLLADDDVSARLLFGTLLRGVPAVDSVYEVEDGLAAVELGRTVQFHVAVFDLCMPRLDGVEAALRLRDLQPSVRIALHSSDPALLRVRAAGLELPLFSKLDFAHLVEWVASETGTGDARPIEVAARMAVFGAPDGPAARA